MSVPVSLEELRTQIEQRARAPYLLTVSPDGRPHAVAVPVVWKGDELVAAPGNRTAANAAARALVSLLWPPDDAGGYSLIVDASVTGADTPGTGDNRLVLRPTTAVLHRPAADPDTLRDGCTSDCQPLFRESSG